MLNAIFKSKLEYTHAKYLKLCNYQVTNFILIRSYIAVAIDCEGLVNVRTRPQLPWDNIFG